MQRRYISYLALIFIVVPGAVYVLSRESPRVAGVKRPPPPPAKPWEPSADFDKEANANFKVESDRTDNSALAGNVDVSDWPEFNGVNRDNRSPDTGLLREWPDGGPPLDWTAKGLGEGYSTVSVVDGVLYTMGNKGQVEAVMALDAGTGEKIWSTPIGWASHPSAGDGPRSTPTVHEGAVFALGGTGELACLDAKSGKIRWQKNILETYGGSALYWGICESVLVDQGKLICTPGGDKATVVALDPASGVELWTSLVPGKDDPGYASPAVAEVGGVRQYVHFTSDGVIGVRADDGEFLWRDDTSANSSANCSSPLVVDDLIFSASSYGTGGSLVKLTSRSTSTQAELVYHTDDMKSHHGDMVIVDRCIYGSNDPGILTCLELETGKVLWQNRSVGKGAVTYADGCIYLRSEKGDVALVEANRERYRELGRFEQPQRSGQSAWAHPVVAARRLFLRDQDVLLCYDLSAHE